MPIKKCPNCNGKIHPYGRARMSEGSYKDINGMKHARYWHYHCEDCGEYWVRDVQRSVWNREEKPISQ